MRDLYDRELNPIDELETRKTKWDGYRVLRHRNERGYDISTVWLGLNHRHSGYGGPIVFETLIWDGDGVEVCAMRHESEENAARWHLKAVDAIRAGRTPDFNSETWLVL